jgi:hypothetical protein
MWIEMKVGFWRSIFNSKNIVRIELEENVKVVIGLNSGDSTVYCKDEDHALAVFEGFILALNGLDFVSEEEYIKPLLQSKNESMYQYMKFKETLNERK